jgi:predicted nucleic acid-binding protein
MARAAPGRPRVVLIDASALIALLDASDQYHRQALDTVADPSGLLTTTAALIEAMHILGRADDGQDLGGFEAFGRLPALRAVTAECNRTTIPGRTRQYARRDDGQAAARVAAANAPA